MSNLADLEKKITEKSKVVITVSLYGNIPDMDKISGIAKKNKLFIIEDNAQGVLAKQNGKQLGSWGIASSWSFENTKHISTGEGGMLITNDRKIYESLNSVGVGTHTFKYPDIKVNIDGVVSAGTTSSIPSYYTATAVAEIEGSIENVYVGSGGTAYGTDNTVNYSRQPHIELLTGEGANLVPIIESGAIVDVMILTQGKNYTSAPDLQVVGTGTTQGFARLKANVSDGKLVSVDILSGGKNYVRNQTDIVVIPSGKGARFNAEIYEWKFNAVEYYDKYLSNVNNDGMVQVTSPQLFKGAKPCSFYPSKKYRNLVGDNIGPAPTYAEGYTSHGKLLGWAYDGNPIFGTIGERAGIGVTWMQSSYSIDLVTAAGLRPSLSVWSSGHFVQDYN